MRKQAKQLKAREERKMIIEITEGKTLMEIIDFLYENLPDNVSEDEISDISYLILGTRGNEIVVNDKVTIKVVLQEK